MSPKFSARLTASPNADQLYGFCTTVDAAPSLDLLKAVDDTVDTLVGFERYLSGSAQVAYGITENIKALSSEGLLDESGFCIDVLEKAEASLKSIYKIMEKRPSSARADPLLIGDHEDSVVAEYQRVIDAVQDLHDCMRDLRWAVLEHNASLQEDASDAFHDADSLIASLRA